MSEPVISDFVYIPLILLILLFLMIFFIFVCCFRFLFCFFTFPSFFYIEASGASGATASNIACWGPSTLVFKYTNRLCTSTTIGEEMVRVEHDMTCKVAAGSLAASSKGNLNDIMI